MAKYTMQAASSATPVDLNMGFSQSVPAASTAATSMAVLAATTPAPTAINVHSSSTLPTIQNPHYAIPVSSLLGMKSLPVLAVHPAAASSLTQGLSPYTAKMQTPGVKKSERQKFAPYWRPWGDNKWGGIITKNQIKIAHMRVACGLHRRAHACPRCTCFPSTRRLLEREWNMSPLIETAAAGAY